jgi:hypothetical protein
MRTKPRTHRHDHDHSGNTQDQALAHWVIATIEKLDSEVDQCREGRHNPLTDHPPIPYTISVGLESSKRRKTMSEQTITLRQISTAINQGIQYTEYLQNQLHKQHRILATLVECLNNELGTPLPYTEQFRQALSNAQTSIDEWDN